jgi:phosphatidylglycerol:prolipoprotein diacylglycerol transferase
LTPARVYLALLYSGLVAGVWAGSHAAAVAGLDRTRAYAAMLLLLVPALGGSRLLFVAVRWRVYRTEPRRIGRWSEGGSSMYGGLLLAFLVSVPLLAALGVPFWTFWDAASVTMLVGMVFARAGCLANGCCAGRETAGVVGLRLADHRGVVRRRIPTQILEALAATAILAACIARWPRRAFEGDVFLFVVAAYGAARLLLEGMREDVERVGGFSLHRAVSAGLVALALAGRLALE